ncbi:MAG: GHKL domain-containing protein [Lachnospiraceae bacterium]|nr:GHKL domain-containing protein [Lachnospiraceae bacterium]
MNVEIGYRVLDLLVTILEIGLLYECNHIFCKKPKHFIWSKVPYFVIIIIVYVLTWRLNIGALKFFVMMILFLGMQKMITKEAWYALAAAYSLYAIFISLSGYSCILIVDAIWGYTNICLEEHIVSIWQAYAINGMITIIWIVALRKGFARFEYDITAGNSVIIILYGIITYLISGFVGSGYYTGKVDWVDSTVWGFALLVGCLLLILFLYYKNNILLKQEKFEIEQKYAFYKEKAKEEECIRAVYHDFKNHLLLLERKVSNNEEARQMVNTLQEQIADYERFQNTGNEFLNIIICDKARIAREENIDFYAVLQFHDGGFIDPLDISTIFGNAIDNAIEASRLLPLQERMITVKANRFHDMLSILIQNNRCKNLVKNTKEDSYMHGFGKKNIKKAVEKYAGQISVHEEETQYILKIIIPIPQDVH